MRYLLLDYRGTIVHISETIGYQGNGNPLVDGGTLAYPAVDIARVESVESVPEGVAALSHRYVDGAFQVNPDWTEPVGGDIDEAMAILQGTEGA